MPAREIRRGGPDRDGIPAIDRPQFVSAATDTFMRADDRVLGVTINGVAKAYAVRILDWHEVVNDPPLIVTYCPLCGSGMAFETAGRRFGVSGLLYNSDVLLYDRETESLWSQILGLAINGPLKGQTLEDYPLLHTTWEKWLAAHPDTLVLSPRSGYTNFGYDERNKNYARYEQSPRTMFPVSNRDRRFHAKAWVLGLEIAGAHKAYAFEDLAKVPTPLRDEIGGQAVLVHYDGTTAWAVDDQGDPIHSVRLFWFAWFAFHPETQVFEP